MLPVVLSVWGCNLIDPEESIPTYVAIDSFDFVISNPTKEGTAAHGITCAWIYYNNNPVGVFDLPCRVPVITQGSEGTISVAPGISLNGLVDLQPQYPFYKFDTVTLKTEPKGIMNYTPKTGYLAATRFRFKEDFEVGNIFEEFRTGVIGDTSIVRISKAQGGDVFEGGGSGMIYLDANNSMSENISQTTFPISAGESFLEVNYKCNVPFQVGLFNTLATGVDAYEYIFGVKPSDNWNKIYIELGSYTGQYPGRDYRVMIKSELTEGMSEGYILLDNIKVISF